LTLDEALKSDSIAQLKVSYEESQVNNAQPSSGSLYMTLISILHRFNRAGRTVNWLLYLQACSIYLPASGHYNYTKSCAVLEQESFSLIQQVVGGFFVLKRTNNYYM
jgi:hypothetical protein